MRRIEYTVERRKTKHSEWVVSEIRMTEQEIFQQNLIAKWDVVRKVESGR